MKTKKGLFITFEGPDGSGKTTQSILLARYLRRKGYKVIHTREPGGTSMAEALRKILLNPKSKIFPLAEVFLYEASRTQHTKELILPALCEGKIVICERYSQATIAYQGHGRGINISLLRKLNRVATEGLKPDITFMLDRDVKGGLEVKKNQDRLEKEKVAFHRRVRKGYLNMARSLPHKIKVIKFKKGPQEIHKEIVKEIEKKLVR